MSEPRRIPLEGYRELPPGEMVEEAERFLALMRRRRSVRDFEALVASRTPACLAPAWK